MGGPRLLGLLFESGEEHTPSGQRSAGLILRSDVIISCAYYLVMSICDSIFLIRPFDQSEYLRLLEYVQCLGASGKFLDFSLTIYKRLSQKWETFERKQMHRLLTHFVLRLCLNFTYDEGYLWKQIYCSLLICLIMIPPAFKFNDMEHIYILSNLHI